jgi:hypothetical protein
MSMRLMLDTALAHGTLRRWVPLVRGGASRTIYVEEALFEEITCGDTESFRMGVLSRDLDHFCNGGLITVGRGRESTCRMKPLDPAENEVWEIRSRDPIPQVRVFGRFCFQDEFVATSAEYRDVLGDPDLSKWQGNNWPAEIVRCERVWERVLPSQQPHSGAVINDYISKGAIELGNLA